MNIIPITSPTAPELEIYTSLNETQLKHYYEPNGGLFISESPTVTRLALDAGYNPVSMLLSPRDIEGEAREVVARVGSIPVYTIEDSIIDQIDGFHLIRGAQCLMERRTLPTLEQLVKDARRVAVLDNVQNPTNVGAIIRCAAALGIDAVIVTCSCSDPLYRRASRVSMGTVFQIPWTMLDKNDSENYIDILRSFGFKTAALALDDKSISIDDPILKQTDRLALVLGSEGYGLPADTIKKCAYTVKIPMYHGVDSLNVAAAAAVAFWQLR